MSAPTQPDIVEQLREAAWAEPEPNARTRLLSKAIDEIERLRAPSGVPSERAPPRNEVPSIARYMCKGREVIDLQTGETLGEWTTPMLAIYATDSMNRADRRALSAPPAGQGGEKS